jgi:hypothetical protein
MTDTVTVVVPSRPARVEVVLPWQSAVFATLEEASDWLDHLEVQGAEEHELTLLDDGRFNVRWR